MGTPTIIEREFSLEEAEQRILADLSRLGLSVETQTQDQHVVAVQACLSAPGHPRLARGAGKGDAHQARVGALYEALEHYLSEHSTTVDVHFVNSKYFADTPMLADDDLLSLISQQTQAVTACRRYTDLQRQTAFYYPITLCHPGYQAPAPDTTDYRTLRRYASNSGTAIGASHDEALLHAINECIERDALSLFLLDQFYYENRSPLRRVERSPDEGALEQLWSAAEAEVGGEIVVLDISNEFLPRTFLAFSTIACEHPKIFGSGCSLDARHAASRALTELVQLHHATTQAQTRDELDNAQRHLKLFPRLRRCLQCNVQPLLDLCPQSRLRLSEPAVELPLAEQITLLADDLHDKGLTVGVAQLHRTDLGTTLVNVVIPGLEHFFVVSSGNVVTAHSRGRRLEKTAGPGS